MSIVDALIKAKQLAKENRSKARREPGISPAVAKAAASAITPQHAVAPVKTVIRPVVLHPDETTCVQSRLLIPGAQQSLDRNVESAFRMLRTRVLQRARSQGWTTLGITSASADDGKTMVALNLALSIAREKNNEVFVIDLDMRNPSICNALGLRPPHHISDYFLGDTPPGDFFIDVGVDNLTLVGGTLTSDRSSELLSTSKFEELIDFIKGGAPRPLVIIDLPPVLTTDDALVLAPRLDAMLIVTSEGKTDRELLDRAVDMLSEFRLAGYVLNRSKQAVTGYYGGY